MYIKVYFDDKPLFLCNDIDRTVEPFMHHDDAIFIDELNAHTVKAMIHEMQQPKVHAGIFFHPDLEKLRADFFRKFTVVKAAGGLVENEKGEILFIFRRGSWDFPKGKLDAGEKIEHCALREVREETGIRKPAIVHPLVTTNHTYHEGTRFILKESHWFHMKAASEEVLKPQTEEDIADIKWVPADRVRGFLATSYPSIRDIVEHFQAVH